jgi:ribosomal protein L11 methyltransferase
MDYLMEANNYSCPQDLYIYLIDGVVSKEDEKEFGESFIGNWVEDSSSFLFFSEPSDEQISKFLKRHMNLSLSEDYHFTFEDWQGGGLETFRIGRFLIRTPWAREFPDKDTLPITLDPGVVFGNGLHPTTRDCLQALFHTFKHQPFRSVIDLGTGTGILAIAAALLGAENILAVDLNPLCVKTAIKNIELNQQSRVIQAIEGYAEDYAGQPADLVLANIHHEVVARLMEDGCHLNKKRLIISGLMRSQARDVKVVMEQLGLTLIREWVHEMTWYTMLIQGSRN